MMPLVSIAFTGMDWWRWYADSPPSPITWSVITILITIYCVYKVLGYKKQIKKLKLARDGEKAVGQYLELLREKGYRVFHDIVGNNFNLDHVIVCEHGVFVVETKAYSKPTKGQPKITFTGSEIIVNGFNTGNKIIIQASAEIKWLQSVIKETTGKKISVQGAIVFPGWYINNKQAKNRTDLWVLNPKALPKYIGNMPKSLTKEDMMLVSYHLSRFIRTTK